jgi:hypothetical protein
MQLFVTSSVRPEISSNGRSDRREQTCLGLTSLGGRPTGLGLFEGKTLTLNERTGSSPLLSDQIVLLEARVNEKKGTFAMRGFAVTKKDPRNPKGCQQIKISGHLRSVSRARALTGSILVEAPA